MDQCMHSLIYLHINILYGNSYTFKKKIHTGTFKFNGPIHSQFHALIYLHIHILCGNSFAFKKFHTHTFKFDGPIHSHSFITTFTFCMATATHSKNSYRQIHIQIWWTKTFKLIYLHIHILFGNSFTFTIFIPTHSNSNLMEQYVHSFTFQKFHTNTFTFDGPNFSFKLILEI